MNNYQIFHAILNRIHPISPDDSFFLYAAFDHRKMKKGEYFTKAGEIPRRIGIVLKGVFRYCYITPKGKEYTKYFCTENQFIVSYSAAIQNKESLYFIQALEDSEILSARFNDFFSRSDSLEFGQLASRKMAEKLLAEKVERESDLLLLDAKERYVKFIKKHPQLINRVNQYYIASYLGISPESLSRIRKALVS